MRLRSIPISGPIPLQAYGSIGERLVAEQNARTPAPTTRTGGYQPQCVTQADHDSLAELMKQFGPRTNSKLAVRRKFNKFCIINGIQPREAVPLWLAQMRRCGLKPGTLETYMNHVINKNGQVYTNIGLWPIRTAIQRAHAAAKTGHAKDGPRVRLFAIISKLKSVELRAMLWMIIGTGGRACDCARLNTSDIFVSTWNRQRKKDGYTSVKTISTQWCLTKNRGRRELRFYTTHPTSWCGGIPHDVEKFLHDRAASADGGPIFSMAPAEAATILNAAIHEVSDEGYTTYSWRRAFMFKVFTECRGDLSQAILYSGHIKTSTFNAYYRKWKNLQSEDLDDEN